MVLNCYIYHWKFSDIILATSFLFIVTTTDQHKVSLKLNKLISSKQISLQLITADSLICTGKYHNAFKVVFN